MLVSNTVLVELPAEQRRLDDSNEGCLSVPTAYAPLARPDYAEVTGQDEKGNPIKVRGTGYFARCLRRETDGLYGYLYIDRLSKRERKEALRQMAERAPLPDRRERLSRGRTVGGSRARAGGPERRLVRNRLTRRRSYVRRTFDPLCSSSDPYSVTQGEILSTVR